MTLPPDPASMSASAPADLSAAATNALRVMSSTSGVFTVGMNVNYNLVARVPHTTTTMGSQVETTWTFGTVLDVRMPPNALKSTYDVIDHHMHDVNPENVRVPGGTPGAVNVGDMCEFLWTGWQQERPPQWYPGKVLGRRTFEDTDDTSSYLVCFVHSDVHEDELQPAPIDWINIFAYLYMAGAPTAMMAIVCTSTIFSTDNVISHSESGDGPKSAYALITPAGCNLALGRQLYGNDTSLWWSSEGWQFFQRAGMCPISGIDRPLVHVAGGGQYNTVNYRGCLSFANGDVWRGMDKLNNAAGFPTNLAAAASTQLGTFQTLNNAGCILTWIALVFTMFTMPLFVLAFGHVVRLALLLLWWIPMGIAFILYLVTLRIVLSSDLLKGDAYKNNIFRSCTSVDVQMYRPKADNNSSYDTHLTLICFIGLLWGMYTLTLPAILTRKVPHNPPAPPSVGSPDPAGGMEVEEGGVGTADVELVAAVPLRPGDDDVIGGAHRVL